VDGQPGNRPERFVRPAWCRPSILTFSLLAGLAMLAGGRLDRPDRLASWPGQLVPSPPINLDDKLMGGGGERASAALRRKNDGEHGEIWINHRAGSAESDGKTAADANGGGTPR
jgi:hypothetical protein